MKVPSVDGTIVLWMNTPVLLERTDDHGTVATDIHGLSPRVRGNQPLQVDTLDRGGSIPACAGEPGE